MITEYQYYQVLTERDEALAKVESLTEQVASLEEVRAKEYAFKQAKVEELQEKIDDLINARNLAWDKGYSQGRDDAHQTITGLQAKVEELTKATGGTCEKHPQLQVPVGCICHYCLDEVRRATITEQQAKVEELTAENKQLNTDLRIALSVQGANGFKLSLKEGTGIQDMMAEVEALSQEGE